MPGLVPGIHVLNRKSKDVDGRDKPGRDAEDGGVALLKGEATVLRKSPRSPPLSGKWRRIIGRVTSSAPDNTMRFDSPHENVSPNHRHYS